MDYSYDYYYGYSGMTENQLAEFMEEFGFAFLGFVMIFVLIAMAVGIVMYVFKSVGLHTIAKRRGIRNAWLVWIPVACYWVEGCISDQYQYVVKGKVRNRRKIMLALSIASVVINSVVQVVSNLAVVSIFASGAESSAMTSGAISMVSGLLSAGLSVAVLVFHYIAMYDLYTSCSPQNNVLFLVLSIIFNVTEPFFIFFNRKKEGGMPPRRQEPQTGIPAEPESWNSTEL